MPPVRPQIRAVSLENIPLAVAEDATVKGGVPAFRARFLRRMVGRGWEWGLQNRGCHLTRGVRDLSNTLHPQDL